MVEHIGGSLRSGHYVAYTKRKANLTSSSQSQEQTLQSGIGPVPNPKDCDIAGDAECAPGALQHPITGFKGNSMAFHDSAILSLEHLANGSGSGSHEGSNDFGESEEARKSSDSPNESRNTSSPEPDGTVRNENAPGRIDLDALQEEAWFRISDTHVCKTSVEQVLSCEAYILLYEQTPIRSLVQ